jgi:hypothetical protein
VAISPAQLSLFCCHVFPGVMKIGDKLNTNWGWELNPHKLEISPANPIISWFYNNDIPKYD